MNLEFASNQPVAEAEYMGAELRISFQMGVCARKMNPLGTLGLDLDGFDLRTFGQKKLRNECGETRRSSDGDMFLKKRCGAIPTGQDEQPRECRAAASLRATARTSPRSRSTSRDPP